MTIRQYDTKFARQKTNFAAKLFTPKLPVDLVENFSYELAIQVPGAEAEMPLAQHMVCVAQLRQVFRHQGQILIQTTWLQW
jgi:hypothetical protein